MKYLFLIAFMACQHVSAQLSENYDDGNFTSNPQWVGDSAAFVIDTGRLRSASSTPDHRFYLATQNNLAYADWAFRVKLDFSTSSLNYVDVYLLSSNENPAQPGNTGYFVRLGFTQDEVSLYRKDASGEVKIIDGVDGSLAGSSNELVVRLSRSPANRFMLFRDIGPTGNFFAEGSVVDANYTSTEFFSFLVRQGSSSFFQKHYFDDVLIESFHPDTLPPAILNIATTSANKLDLEFSEPVEPVTALSPANYTVTGSVGLASSVSADPFNPALFHLQFFNNFPEREELRLSATGITDLSGNPLSSSGYPFVFFTPVFGDVLIHEIMADPSPPQHFPETEWIELRNRSGLTLSLAGWKFCKSFTCVTLPPYILSPDSMVVLSSASGGTPISNFAPSIAISGFPSLNNDGDVLSLYSPEGKVIHAVKYADDWYNDDFKMRGGFSLEMKDADHFCLGSENWSASTSPAGATPGRTNSLSATVQDLQSPVAFRLFVTDSTRLMVVFNELLDSAAAAGANYTISPGSAVPLSVLPVAPFFDRVAITLSAPLDRNILYGLTVSGVADCSGNISGTQTINFGIPEQPRAGEVLINEILFNPSSDCVDFVELYNNSNKTFSLDEIFIANRNDAGTLNSIVNISNDPVLLMPGEFIVITESAEKVQRKYMCGASDRFITLFTPSMPDDKGEVVILNSTGDIVDEVNYEANWHFPLISNDEGISLERISYSGSSSDPGNWHSAASSHGFATPGLRNSQSRVDMANNSTICVVPGTISPNSDGYNDFATILYELTANGYTANLTIFDSRGQLVRLLCRNELCGTKGFWKWDGLGDNSRILPAGAYIIFIELLNPSGDRAAFKKVVLLAGETS